jgi:hypothetical protein
MGSDPKKPILQEEEDEGSTAMFSREAHGWFSSMADARESDAESVADLARNAVTESSPLSRTGGLPAVGAKTGANPVVNLGRTGAQPASTRNPTPLPPAASQSPASRSIPSAPRAHAADVRAALANLSGRQVVLAAFLGGALLAAVIGGAAFFLLTPR